MVRRHGLSVSSLPLSGEMSDHMPTSESHVSTILTFDPLLRVSIELTSPHHKELLYSSLLHILHNSTPLQQPSPHPPQFNSSTLTFSDHFQ
ncbi:hypothetical protein GCK72_003087 [Caenorhabditis remanei]|uniref:Uncharacterized protein n=1 Tax=Caenorhabditis remanei TaxID=31234 RepID=A0A6A5HVP5_CAERE|nr:hypothetical protein GCK72_003087 [Caenorhabditis remanei]KAF1771261.1 hypothetical protein GCK72_003087 [Caenorhabditis remanei]